MTARNDATERQVQAARPDASTWLAANAGSGKTRVLTDRVARLLLDGVLPEHILCLTYTKAAASEMQNRLFRRLGDWAMRSDAELAETLAELGVTRTVTAEQLAHARTLFARAIETPGGLKIQTIHSFCAALLRRFPLEAGVSPQFAEMENRAAELLQAEIVDDLAAGPQAHLVDGVAQFLTDTTFDGLTRALVQRRDAFQNGLEKTALWRNLGLPEGYDEARLCNEVFLGGEADLLERLRIALRGGSKTDMAMGTRLSQVSVPDLSDLPLLESLFLTGKATKSPFSTKIGTVPTKATQKANAAMMPELDALMQRVEAARPMRLGLACAQKTQALHNFALAFLPEYARRKQLRGWLDFDDLILKARHLLNDPAVAQWVLFRLDGGIDHILVDEAQDTSPVQWDVIEKLAQEFTSGQGARSDRPRTIFVVGDKKQSIYSFQGADPEEFDRMQTEFSQRLAGSGAGLQDLTLDYSFRSSKAILQLVDLVFADQTEAGFRRGAHHIAFKSDLPGRVDLWPVVEKVSDQYERVWTDPVDRPSPQHHNVVLAKQIAASIKRMIDSKETLPVDDNPQGKIQKRPVQAGDFLILVQRRSDLFGEIIRACKAADLPIAGADRLKVGAELAVKDLAALLNFLTTPEDSLSLASVLKSPLLGWDEQALFDLAHRRDTPFLWTALRNRADEFPETMDMLNDLRGQTDFLRPYDLIERILTRHGGRRKLLSRLGAEAEDGINALLSQALSYERSDIPSLTGFLVWMETDDLEIKRQIGNAGNMVRVMTVHGAKGLESPIVILPDTGPRRAPPAGEIVMIDDMPLWRMNAADMPEAMSDGHAATQQRQLNERLRLLYVALTRAEKWLIVAAAGELSKSGDSWYQMVEAGMIEAGAEPWEFEAGMGLRLAHGDWNAPEFRAVHRPVSDAVPAPGFVQTPAPPPDRRAKSQSPSELGGAKALAGDAGLNEEAAKLRGSRVHLLLEHLPDVPQAGWNEAAFGVLPGLNGRELAQLLAEARNVLTNPNHGEIFSPEALAEVPVTAEISGQRFHGTIDRLLVSDRIVRAIDFKTNATVPETPEHCPEGLLRQMGGYAAMLARIYPDHSVETAILWTRTATLMPLPHDIVSQAFWRAPSLDDGGPRS